MQRLPDSIVKEAGVLKELEGFTIKQFTKRSPSGHFRDHLDCGGHLMSDHYVTIAREEGDYYYERNPIDNRKALYPDYCAFCARAISERWYGGDPFYGQRATLVRMNVVEELDNV